MSSLNAMEGEPSSQLRTGYSPPAEVDPQETGGFLFPGDIPALIPEGGLTDATKEEGTVSVGKIDVSWSGWVSDDPVYDGRLILAEGWTAIPELYDDFCKALAERGITALTFKTPRIEGVGAFSPLSFFHAWSQQPEAIQAVEEDTRKISGNDASDNHVKGAHSGSAESALKAALEDPENTDYVLLAGSAGQTGHSWLELLAENIVLKFIPREGIRVGLSELRHNPRRAGKYILNNGMHPWETLGEGVRAGGDNIVPHIEAAPGLGIPVVNILLRNDGIFPPRQVLKHIDGRATVHQSELVGHLAPQTQPAEFAAEVVSLHHQVMATPSPELAKAA